MDPITLRLFAFLACIFLAACALIYYFGRPRPEVERRLRVQRIVRSRSEREIGQQAIGGLVNSRAVPHSGFRDQTIRPVARGEGDFSANDLDLETY